MSGVRFSALSKSYGPVRALDDFDLAVEGGTFTVLCGPPRAGKSVLARILVGLEQPDSGSVSLDGRDLANMPPARRPIGYVPQSFALYPHLTVRANIAYPLKLARMNAAEIAQRVDKAARTLSITPLLGKTPDQLSGGEKQRVAVARGLVRDARVFVLDDPLVGLDYKLRERLMDELKALRHELGATFVYLTSDSLEALNLAQNLAVVENGRLVEHGEATLLYHEPGHVRSLALIGFPRANVLQGRSDGTTLRAGPLSLAHPPGAPAGEVAVGIRPEKLNLGKGGDVVVPARVQLVENLGGDIVVYLDAEGQDLTMCYANLGQPLPAFGSAVEVSFDRDALIYFDASGRRIAAGAAAGRPEP